MPEQRYEFRVNGLLSPSARDAVGDICELVVRSTPPETIIYSVVADQGQLHGMLSFLENLGLHVVAVQRLPHRLE